MQLHSEFKFNSVISFSFWGLRPQTPTRGSAPGPRWGTLIPQILSAFGPPNLDDGLTPLVDGTFKVVRRPFHQLLSIHAYVRRNGTMKHVPLLFVQSYSCLIGENETIAQYSRRLSACCPRFKIEAYNH